MAGYRWAVRQMALLLTATVIVALGMLALLAYTILRMVEPVGTY
jgi:hypothetical protein